MLGLVSLSHVMQDVQHSYPTKGNLLIYPNIYQMPIMCKALDTGKMRTQSSSKSSSRREIYCI